MSDLYLQLSDPFPQEMERSISKSGVNLTYIPISEVINRLNKVLGVDKWSFTVVKCERDAIDTDFVIAHVRLEYSITEFQTIARDGIGGQKIKRNKQGAIVDLGDEFKGAISDALKKAAQTMGVGLYLARSDDAMEIEQAIEASANAPVVSLPTAKTVPSGKHAQAKEMFEALSDDDKKKIKQFYSEYSKGAKKPISQMTNEEIEVITAEMIRMKFDGAMVAPSDASGMPERKDLD